MQCKGYINLLVAKSQSLRQYIITTPNKISFTLRDPIKRAAELGVEVPIMATAYELLKSAR
jgi:hypothetical protein